MRGVVLCEVETAGPPGVRGVCADLVNLQKIVPIVPVVPTSKHTVFSLRIGDDLRHSFSESNDSDDLDVTDVLMGRYTGQS